MALRAEAAHEKGRTGVFATKTWLESTTYMEFNFDAYRFAPMCTVTCLNGDLQTFDLAGVLYERNHPLYVEVKTYDTVGGQAKAYDDFLAISYSATAKMIAEVGDWTAEFMWVTTHPFAQGEWPRLTTREHIMRALEVDETGLLDGQPIDESILSLMADRVRLLVLNMRQHELVLNANELGRIEAILNRKGR